MIYFLATVAAIAGFLFGYDEGVIAVASPLLERDYPMSPLVEGFMTASVPLGASTTPSTEMYSVTTILPMAVSPFRRSALRRASRSSRGLACCRAT